MPKGVVKTKRDEEKWEKAKGIAEEAGHKDDYAYIMGIYKKMKPDYDFKTEDGKKKSGSERIMSLATDSQVQYALHLIQMGLRSGFLDKKDAPEEAHLRKMDKGAISEFIDGMKKKRGRPMWYGNGKFRGWEKSAAGPVPTEVQKKITHVKKLMERAVSSLKVGPLTFDVFVEDKLADPRKAQKRKLDVVGRKSALTGQPHYYVGIRVKLNPNNEHGVHSDLVGASVRFTISPLGSIWLNATSPVRVFNPVAEVAQWADFAKKAIAERVKFNEHVRLRDERQKALEKQVTAPKPKPVPPEPTPAPAPPKPAPAPEPKAKFDVAEVKSALKRMSTPTGGRILHVDFYGDGWPSWSAEPSNRQRLDHYVGSNHYNWDDDEDFDEEGWDEEGWEDDYAGPLRAEVTKILDSKFGKGTLEVDIGEKGHIDVSIAKGKFDLFGLEPPKRRFAADGKYDHINFVPPESVANAAARGLEYRQKASPSNRGGLTPSEASKEGIGSGVQRASDLKNRKKLSPETISKMVAFFARHEKNKSVKDGKKPWEDKGHVAWLLWGGDPGKAWAEKVKRQMETADQKKSASAEHAVAQRLLSHLLAALRAAQQSHWTMHWTVKGTSFYGDHQMFERLYEGLSEEIDTLAEKMVAGFGEQAVNLPEQMKWQAFLAYEWDKDEDLYYRALHIEQYLQDHFKKTYDALKHLDKMSLGLDDYLMSTANAHETNLYLIGQRIGLRLASRGRLKYRVYLFSETGKTLFKKEFWAADDSRADTEALRLVKPELNKHDDAEDWVVEPVGHKGKKAARPDGIPAVVTKVKGTRKPQVFVVPVDPRKAPPEIAKGDWFRSPMSQVGDKGVLLPPSGRLNQWLFAPERSNPHWATKTARNQKIIEAPHNFHPVKVEPPKAKRKEFPFEGFIDFQGILIDVENVKGSTRRGTGPEGDWATYMHSHYGEIRGTEGVDGDKLDVYVGDNHDSPVVVVIHQHNPWDGKYDEDKVMIGYDSVEESIGAYKKQYDRPGFYIMDGHTAMNIGAFWRWVKDTRNKGKRVTASAKKTATAIEYRAEPRKGWFFIESEGDIGALTQALNQEMVRRVPPPQQVAKVRGARKAFSFHWSNAQSKWDVISVSRDLPWGIDGAEFVVFVGPKALSPTGKLWTLTEMRYVAQKLNPHPGYANSPESAGRRYAAQVGTDTATVYAISPEQMQHIVDAGATVEDDLIQQMGGAVFHTGGDGAFDVSMPDALKEFSYKAPYGTESFDAKALAARYVAKKADEKFARGTSQNWATVERDTGLWSRPESKDYDRAENIVRRARGSAGKIQQLAQNMAKIIKDPAKAARRGRAFEESSNFAVQQSSSFFYDRAYTLMGMRSPGFKVMSPAPPKPVAPAPAPAAPAGPSWNPPAIPANLVPMDARGWQMYDMAGASTAARSLGKVMTNALMAVGRNVTPQRTDAANAKNLSKIIERVNKARYTRDEWGAGDTEPRNVMYDVFEAYIKLYLDQWEYPKTFRVINGW